MMETDSVEPEFSLVRQGESQENLILKLYEKNILGRGYDATMVLTSLYVSRKHCCIFRLDGEWYIMDFDTLNGTYIFDTKLEPSLVYPLKEGDKIGLGINVSAIDCFEYSGDQNYYVFQLISSNLPNDEPIDVELNDICMELSNMMQV